MSQAAYPEQQVDLDDAAMIAAGDPRGMLQALWNLPEQCGEALRIAQEFNPPKGVCRCAGNFGAGRAIAAGGDRVSFCSGCGDVGRTR